MFLNKMFKIWDINVEILKLDEETLQELQLQLS